MPNAWNVLGQDWAVDLLRGQIAQDRLSHAYLITGPEGVGRQRLAQSLAKAVNCQNPPSKGDFCNECRACRGFEQMGYADLHIVEVQEGDRDIRVDAIRELTRMLALSPFEEGHQVALLLNFERASEQAANALLKTLEEPAQRVLILLTADSADRLPATISSRCELLRLRPMPLPDLASGLERRVEISQEASAILAAASGGRPEFALRLHRDPELLDMRRQRIQDLVDLLASSRVERFAFAEKASKDKEELRTMLEVWIAFWRDLLLFGEGAEKMTDRAENKEGLLKWGELIEAEEAKKALTVTEQALSALRGNVNPRLTLEGILLTFPQVSLN